MVVDVVYLTAVALRLLVPLAIFRWQLVGGLLAIFIDLLDTPIIDIFGGTWPFGNYQFTDKLLDTYAMGIMLIASLRWEKLARTISISLFVYRGIGLLAFILIEQRWLFIAFADFFTFFFIFNAARNHFFRNYKLTDPKMITVMFALVVIKLTQEIILHYYHFTAWPQFYSLLPI